MNTDKSIDVLNKLIEINPKTSKVFNLILALGLGLSVSSCSFIGGVFKTGMEAGIFITVAVIILVLIMVFRMRKRSN